MKTFSGQKILVTGATRGIGKGIAEAFLNEGATLIGIYGGNKDAADLFIKENSQHADKINLYQCDISQNSQVEELFDIIEKEHEYIDVLINNAGIRKDSVVALMKADDWQRVIDVNLTGSFLMAKQAVLSMMKQKYGRIINITSPMAHLGFAGQANYSASKAGQIGMTKSLAKETAKKKITVNCISPGFIKTDLIEDLTKDQLKEYKKLVPMRRFGKIEEVSAAVLFIASKEASYITGAVLDINGGL